MRDCAADKPWRADYFGGITRVPTSIPQMPSDCFVTTILAQMLVTSGDVKQQNKESGPVYSIRNADIGSTFVALRAGK